MVIAMSGSHGFLGKHLHKALADLGHGVLCIPREILYQPKELEAFFQKEQPQYIFHLASYGNHRNQPDIAMMVFSNIIGTFNILHASKDIPYKLFVNFGSSSEYGIKDMPMKETDLPQPDTFYAASKVGATMIARAFAKQFNKPILTVRPFSIYGPEEADFRFIPSVCKHLIEGTEMHVDLYANHDWIYVGDVVKKLLTLFWLSLPDFRGNISNIGTGLEYSNKEVIELLEQISGKKLKKKIIKTIHTFDSPHWKADEGQEITPLKEGLQKTWEYYKKKYDQSKS